MSQFAKASTMLRQLSDSHDMTAAAERRTPNRELILIQVKDAAGFWCNAATAPSVRVGIGMAKEYQQTLACPVQVCVGPKRDVVWTVA